MARAIWSGSIGFGLVNVPVGLYSATEDKTVHSNQFEKGTDDRVRNKRVNEETGEEVEYSDVVKGYDLGDGRHVIVTPEELEEVEPGKSSTIAITDFVSAAEIDPVYYRRSYYLAPKTDDAAKPYGLLLQAMEKAERLGIATFVMRGTPSRSPARYAAPPTASSADSRKSSSLSVTRSIGWLRSESTAIASKMRRWASR